MIMATAISIVALLISMASLAFNFRQYKAMQILRKYEKANSVIRHALELRKKSQDLRNIINSTDNIEVCDVFLDGFDLLFEKQIAMLAEKKITTLAELFEMEKHLLSIELEIDLMSKQVEEADRWNKEEKQFSSATNTVVNTDAD